MSEPWGGRPDSVARALQIFLDPWAFAVLREGFFGVRRFDDFASNLDISRSVLTKRLKHLIKNGIFTKELYQSRPDRFEYRLTEKGLDMYPIFAALMCWGDRWLAGPEGPPLLLVHNQCGQQCTARTVCSQCGEDMKAREIAYIQHDGHISEFDQR